MRSAKDPICQNTISSAANGFGERLKTSAFSAPPKADKARPSRIIVEVLVSLEPPL